MLAGHTPNLWDLHWQFAAANQQREEFALPNGEVDAVDGDHIVEDSRQPRYLDGAHESSTLRGRARPGAGEPR